MQPQPCSRRSYATQNVHPSHDGIKLVHAEPTIVFGADVYHAPPFTDRPSFAAVVSAVDRTLTTYHTTVSMQTSRCEVIEDMENLAFQHLRRFYELNHVLPLRIIFYRDGVGITQFSIIEERELQAIRRACTRVGGDAYKPRSVSTSHLQRPLAPAPPGNQHGRSRRGAVVR